MRRLLSRPDLPLTGLGRSYRLALDSVVLIAVVALIAIAVTVPLSPTLQPFVLFAILPVAVLRSRQ